MSRWTRALVTGASSGIGDAIARRLAADGTDLVVVARDEARLASDDQPIDLLVNNAGFGFTGNFIDLDIDRETAVIEVNVVALTRLAHAAGTAMARRGSGGIINTASIAGLIPAPGTATYGATKAFVVSLGDSLNQELGPKGVKVSTICPGFTRTEFQDRAEYDASDIPGFMWQSADDVAAAALAGVAGGSARVVPGLPNKLTAGTTKLLPGFINRRIAGLLSDA